MQVNIAFIIPKLIDGVLSHEYLKIWYNFIVTLVPNEEEFPHKCEQGAWWRPDNEGGVERVGPSRMKMWSSPGAT